MIVLGIDTSTMTGGAALVSEEGLIGEYVLNIRTTHSERLLPAIDRLLDDASLSLQDLFGVAVVTGPGSFTGLRIGLATAKGFAFVHELALVGVTLFTSLAYQFLEFPGIVCSLVDARRGEVYAQAFKGLEEATDPLNCPLKDILDWCQDQSEPILFVGDGASNHQERIRQHVKQSVFPPREGMILRSSSVAGLGRRLLADGVKQDALSLSPFYMRRSEAELKWLERQ